MRAELAIRYLFCLIFCLGQQALAVAPISFYAGEVPVNSQSEAERTGALKTALAQVVMRITGNESVLANNEVAAAVAQAEQYMQQFQYRREVVNDHGQLQVKLTLVAQFDRDAVERMLSKLGLTHANAPATATNPAAGSYRVWINGVRSADDYARLINLLTGNEWVREVKPEQARGDGVLVVVTLNAGLPSLLNDLTQSRMLEVSNRTPPLDGVDVMLSLQTGLDKSQ